MGGLRFLVWPRAFGFFLDRKLGACVYACLPAFASMSLFLFTLFEEITSQLGSGASEKNAHPVRQRVTSSMSTRCEKNAHFRADSIGA